MGEGESVILDVVEGRIRDKIVNAPCPEDLDRIPFPDYSILKTPCRSANIMSTRGCPFCCSFCTTSRMFHPYRQRSVDSVIEELRYYKKLGFHYMNFEDDNFTADRERAKEICRRMIREGLTFKETFFFGRTDLAKDEEMLDLLREAHLTRVLVGIESLNQKSLDAVNKHQSVDDIKKCTAVLAKHGIRLIASIVLGIDTDTKEDIMIPADLRLIAAKDLFINQSALTGESEPVEKYAEPDQKRPGSVMDFRPLYGAEPCRRNCGCFCRTGTGPVKNSRRTEEAAASAGHRIIRPVYDSAHAGAGAHFCDAAQQQEPEMQRFIPHDDLSSVCDFPRFLRHYLPQFVRKRRFCK